MQLISYRNTYSATAAINDLGSACIVTIDSVGRHSESHLLVIRAARFEVKSLKSQLPS